MAKTGTLVYVGLESIASRYTLQLTDWNVREFKRRGLKYRVVEGTELGFSNGTIDVGQVLDAHNRPFYALSQIQEIIAGLKSGAITKNDTLFFEDMFHPGFEALPYIFNQQGWRPKVFVRCLAQTIDPDDFVHVTGMTDWMRKYEAMVNATVDAVLIASHEMASFATAAGWKVPLVVTGLPFGKDEVVERARYKEPVSWRQREAMWESRPIRVVFAARTDREKQPDFFIRLASYWRANSKVPVEFAFLSGKGLVSNEDGLKNRINDAVEAGTVKFYGDLSKEEYYETLKYSRVLFNCALQDWVSNTVSEADTLGCNVLYPAYRSFPETFFSDHTRLYVPWSIHDAYVKLRRLLLKPHPFIGQISDAQNESISHSVDAMHRFRRGRRSIEYINPQDTSYRAYYNGLHHNAEALAPFWEYSNVLDTQLLDSVRKPK